MAARGGFAWIAIAGAAVASIRLVGACGGSVPLGGPDNNASALAAACAGKSCGDPCATAPCGGDPSCNVASFSGTCDEKGACNPWQSACTWKPCDGASCGDPCAPCDPADPTCPVTDQLSTCDGDGNCVPGASTCPCDPKLGCGGPCFGEVCGSPCDACAPGDPTCTSLPGFCDDAGVCFPGMPKCDPCFGKPCGDWCDPCGGAPDCKIDDAYLCDMNGQCSPIWNVTTCSPDWNPCEFADAMACGVQCNPCDPNSGNCVTPPVYYYCDQGLCRPNAPPPCEDSDCASKSCGTQCKFCGNDQMCEPLFCNGAGACVAAEQINCGGDTDDCIGKGCGDLCMVCNPALLISCPSEASVFLNCDAFLKCTAEQTPCKYQACLGHFCGQACDPCSPGDAGCVPPDEPTFCDPSGACVPQPFYCP